ncbi:MAG: secretin N-terminal domain-containing protein [Nitrospirota bacterium]
MAERPGNLPANESTVDNLPDSNQRYDSLQSEQNTVKDSKEESSGENLPDAGTAKPEVKWSQESKHPEQQAPVRETPKEGQTPEKTQPLAVESKEHVSSKVEIGLAPGSVNLFFDDADIYEVIKVVFGDVLKVNYVIDPKISGRVNFNSSAPIPKDELLPIMEIILRLNGIGFVKEEGLYRIVPMEKVSSELIYAQVGKEPDKVAMGLFTFKNLNIKDSMKDIENAIGLSLKGGQVRIIPIQRLNAILVVASTKEQLDYVRKWVETFDVIFNGPRPKVFAYPIQNGKAKDIADMLNQIFLGAKPSVPSEKAQPAGAPGTAKPLVSLTPSAGGSLVSEITKIFPNEITNSLIILATPDDYAAIEDAIKKIDIAPRQVMIEALVAEIKLTDNMTFGLAWSLKTDVNITGMKPFNKDINLDGTLGFNSSKLSGLDVTSLAGFAFAGVDPAGAVRLLLESLASDSKVNVLAAPHILVSDNREAKIQIGDQVPVATSETNVTGTTQIQRTIQYKDTGIILKVKPQVNESGLVALDITQEVSNFSIEKIFDSDQVVISKREAATSLVAQDGQTIVIGGLISEATSKTGEGIPFLSKIPVLGYLFGSTKNTHAKTELIILLTPHVIRNQVEAANVSGEYLQRMKESQKEIQEYGIKKEGGPGVKGVEKPGDEKNIQ